jgi:chromosome segregation ATPase
MEEYLEGSISKLSKAMNIQKEYLSLLEGQIVEVESRLAVLEQAVNAIGQPAGYELQRRLNALRIESRALVRNYEESRNRGEPDSARLDKIDALLHHIMAEEDSVEAEADFLQQSVPSLMTLAVEAGAQLVDLYRKGFKQVIGDHPLGASAFVNHTRENLECEFGLDHSEEAPAQTESRIP